jgi:hypothetical protein
MTPLRMIAACLGLGLVTVGACVQEPYIKSEKNSGAMMNAAEVDNQAAKRRALEALRDAPVPTPTVTPASISTPSKVNQ